jgi:hypothetical protein
MIREGVEMTMGAGRWFEAVDGGAGSTMPGVMWGGSLVRPPWLRGVGGRIFILGLSVFVRV